MYDKIHYNKKIKKKKKKEYCSGLPFSTPGDLVHPEMEPRSSVSPELAGQFFTSEPPGKTTLYINILYIIMICN